MKITSESSNQPQGRSGVKRKRTRGAEPPAKRVYSTRSASKKEATAAPTVIPAASVRVRETKWYYECEGCKRRMHHKSDFENHQTWDMQRGFGFRITAINMETKTWQGDNIQTGRRYEGRYLPEPGGSMRPECDQRYKQKQNLPLNDAQRLMKEKAKAKEGDWKDRKHEMKLWKFDPVDYEDYEVPVEEEDPTQAAQANGVATIVTEISEEAATDNTTIQQEQNEVTEPQAGNTEEQAQGVNEKSREEHVEEEDVYGLMAPETPE